MVRDVPEIEPVGWVDPNPDAFVDPPPGTRTFGSLRDALDGATSSTLPEAVLVTAGLHAHAPLARAALEAGLDVLIEKPFAPTLHEARELVELAEAQGRTLMVSQNYRFHAAPQRVAALLGEQAIGQIGAVRIDFRKHFRHNPEHPYRRGLQPLLLDMFVHHADLMRFVLGREPRAVHCQSWNPPWSGFEDPASAAMSVDFGGGIVVAWRGSWESTAPATLWAGDWTIEGEQGVIDWSSRGDEGDAAPDWVTVRKGADVERLDVAPLVRADRHGALGEFARAVRTNEDPATSGRDNLGTLGLCLAAIRSAADGRRVTIETPESDLKSGPESTSRRVVR